MKTETKYLLPREKMQQKGVTSLTSAELLQVLIGSGNGQASVSRIAKRTLKVLLDTGGQTQYQTLVDVAGLGPARSSQIIAAFELASRYPINAQQSVIDSQEKAIGLMAELRTAKTTQLIYVTVDGGKRLIAKRKLSITPLSHPSSLLRSMFANIVTDNAAGIYIAIGSDSQAMTPSMFILSFSRDLLTMAQLFLVTIHSQLLVNKQETYSLKRELW